MNQERLNRVITEHALFLAGRGGQKADLSHQNLTGLNLVGANLSGASFLEANLSYTNLSQANVGGANFYGTNLAHSKLIGANFRLANLQYANLTHADFRSAYLEDATLSGANLLYADLREATAHRAVFVKTNLTGADLSSTKGLMSHVMESFRIVPEEGSFIGWATPCRDTLVKLFIPEDAIRANDTRRVCRASRVIPLEVIPGADWHEDLGFTVGEPTEEEWDGNPFRGGIEFRLTKGEAMADMW